MNTPLPTTPSFRLDGRRALVTGASRGIGFAAATALGQAGAHVTLCARSQADLEAAARSLQDSGITAEALMLDVGDAPAVAKALAARPAYDILVNNAGTNTPKPFTEVTEADYDRIMSLNVRAAFFTAQNVARRMIEAGVRGSIIHVSSQMGHVGGQLRTVYCASKWAIEGLSKAMAIDLAPSGIRVNTICPTFIDTPLAAVSLADPACRAHILSKIKLGRLGTVEDLMGAFIYLASDASALMTGTSMVIDGGWTAG
jgi:NAD(P)-dependent dehydrogenase (short-subunit alcohol dehydrogenase family)